MSKAKANCLLLLAAAFWGFGNVAQKTVLEHLDPLSAVGLRCLIGGLLIMPLIATEQRLKFGSGYWASLGKVSVIFAIAMVIQQVAYLGTSVTNASFLVNTETVITPLVVWMLIGQRPTAMIWLAASTALIGVLLMSGGLSTNVGHGDFAALVSGACYALWTVELGRHMQTYGNAAIACATQFLGVAAVATPLGWLFGNMSLAATIDAGPELLILGVFSTAAAFGLQALAQCFTSACHAAVIVSAESVFGAAGAALFLGERLSTVGAIGAAMVLTAIILLASFTRDSRRRKPALTADGARPSPAARKAPALLGS